jgi:hypothetical protein
MRIGIKDRILNHEEHEEKIKIKILRTKNQKSAI